ncbi:MAG: chromosomal replication initiator protein DnaA [Chlamydiales bacterium]|nr:chromosomal replication initiator protein DnaA [Chlamydiales bacterium]
MQAWEKFLLLQEQDLGADTVRKWLRTLRIKDYDAANLYLEARDSFQILWFEEHMRAKVAKGLLNNNQRPIQVHLEVGGIAAKKGKSDKTRKAKTEKEKSEFNLVVEDYDPHCTFDNLVVSESNLLAHKILCEVAGLPLDHHSSSHTDSQLAIFNPIYIYGPSGTGKTHLLSATAHALSARGLDVIYTRAETFTEHVVQAIRAGEMAAFRRYYRNRDVLILDDIHVFSRKSSTQEELFHTFNTLHLEGKQIILSSNCAPQELHLIEPRLVSRFEWGLVMPLEAIKEEEYLHVLRKKSSAMGFEVSSKVQEFLCKTFSSSPKAICAALEALALRTHLGDEGMRRASVSANLSAASVRDILQDLIDEEDRQALRPERIVQAVAESYGIRLEDIFGKSQSREFVTPRQVAMFLCRQNLKMSFAKIGDYFKRDHSTVMSGIRKVHKDLSSPDSDLLSDLSAITKKLHTYSS